MGKRKYEDSTNEAIKRSKSDKNDPGNIQENSDTDTPDQVNPNQKNRKIGAFEVKHFRKELAAKQGQTMVLTQFLQVCLNPDNEVDYLLEYLKIGGNSHEILRQINADNKKNLTLATPAFHLFHLIILKVQSSLPHLISVTEEACRYFLNNFMSTVEIMISENSGPRHRKIVLKLLTSMVTLNTDLGIEVLNQAPLTPKHLQYITEKPNYKEKDNVRTSFVHFMTSFLVEGHLPLIKALLEKQGLLALVIPGLVHDEGEAVLIFLNILKKNVVDNTLISKSLKLKTFSHHVLHNMFKIFSWRGPPETSRENQNEFRPEITSLLSEIILTVFTSHKLGVYFTDNSLGTTDVHKNQNLYKALLSLKRPWENENECEVILKIVDKCPDLHRAVISIIEQSFEPQHSPIWEKTVGFTIKLLEILKPENVISRLLKLSVGQVSNFIRFVTLPLPLLKYINRDLGKDHSVSLYCIKLLVKMLQTLRRYMQLLGMQDSQAQIVDLKSKLEYFFPKHMPAPLAAVALINDVMENKEDTDTQGYRLPKLDKTESLTCLVDLLLLYNDIQPTFFETLEDSINMKKILDFSMTLTTGNTSVLKFKVVSLWLTLDSTGVSVKNSMFKELFLIMLEVYTNRDDDTWIDAKDTLFNFFQNTAIFETDEDEIHLVLYLLRNCKVNPISVIADIVEYVLINIDKLTSEIRKNVLNFENSQKSDGESLDKLLDELTEGPNADDNIFLESKMPSPFVVGCVKYCQVNKTAKKNLKAFLSLYVANLLHSNYSPELSEVLLEDLKLDARSYVSGWIVNPVPLSDSILEEGNILNAVSRSIINGEDIPLNNVFTFIDEVPEEESDFAINNIYYKINENSHIDSSDLIIWAKYLIFCTVRLSDMGLLEQDRQEKITLYFQTLLTIGKIRHLMKTCRSIVLSLFKNTHGLKIYKAVDTKDVKSNLLPTQFILEVINKQIEIINYLDNKYIILKPFQQKNYSEILKIFNKINKRSNMDSEHTMKVLDGIGLTKEDDLLVLNKIFNCEVNCCVKDDKEPSIVLDILQVLLDKYAKSINTDLPQHILRKAMKLYTELLKSNDVTANLTSIELTLINYLENKPHEVAFIPEDIFKKFFYANTVRKSTSNLASILLKHNAKFCKVFKDEISRPEILSQRELTLPLGDAVLNHSQFILNNKDFLPVIYNEYKTNINKLLEKPHKAGQVYINNYKFIKKLVVECMEVQDCQKVFAKIHKYDVVEPSHVDILQTVFMKLCLSDEGHKKEYLVNYLMSSLHILTTALKENKEEEVIAIIFNVDEVTSLCKSIKGFDIDQDDVKKITESAVWQNFCKTVLKDSLKVKKADQNTNLGPKLLLLLSTLVKLLYPPEHEDIVLLFDMVTSHSEFLNVMLSYHSSEIKSSLIEFLYTLTRTNKSVMKLQHVPVYLSSYHATRSPCDRLILAILHFYEKNGQPVNEYKPYVFGDSAANYYAVRKNRSATLWSHPTPNRVLSLFERDIIERTVSNFPVNQKLEYHYELSLKADVPLKDSLTKISKEGIQKSVKDKEGALKSMLATNFYDEVLSKVTENVLNCSHVVDREDIYDPSFVFPLLSHLLAPGSVASCFKVLRTGLLSVPVVALTSLCPNMRAAAYHVLHRFCLLLETETKHKNDKLFLTDFVTTLRQSISSVNNSNDTNAMNPRLPSIDALYLARALMVSTSPADPLYKPVNNFFIAKQLVDLTVVPDFLSLFHDSDVESADRRAWILDVIKDGTKTMTDVNVIFKTMCLKMIMDFYPSILCDRKTKAKILGVLSSLVSIPRASEILVEGYGLISWLKSAVKSISKDDKVLIVNLLNLIRNMLHSLMINASSKNATPKNGKVAFEIKVNKDVEFELMGIVYDLHRHTNGLDVEDVLTYVDVCLLISKRTVKMLTREQILVLVSRVASAESESVKLWSKAIVDNDATVLSSKNNVNVGSEPLDCLLRALTTFLRSYLL